MSRARHQKDGAEEMGTEERGKGQWGGEQSAKAERPQRGSKFRIDKP